MADNLNLLSDRNLNDFLSQARAELLQQQIDGNRWDYHAYLGTHFLAQYHLCLQWLGLKESDVEVETIRSALLATQLSDGSWYQVVDSSLDSGELNTTIFNYWFLKSIGVRTENPVLKRARDFILKQGGIDASSLFTKTFLALFRQYPWSQLARVPYLIFLERLPSNYKSFSQWVIPHLMPMAYLRAKRVAKDLGDAYSLRELWVDAPPECPLEVSKASLLDLPLMRKILSCQQPKGSWGGYTVSTLMSIMAIQHFAPSGLIERHHLELALRRGLEFIDWLYVHAGAGSYKGCLMDGHYWDTLLSANALLEAGASPSELLPVRDYILQTQQACGGFPYGLDFEYAPDVDDTAEAILLFSNWNETGENRWDQKSAVIQKASDWLLSLQNTDGGWGAFDCDNNGNPLLRILTKAYRDSVDLFDDSSADSTGHVLDALSVAGHDLSNSEPCRRAVEYLKRTQERSLGAWIGRWAVNYLFGTTCALVGLIKTGVSAEEEFMQKALRFLTRSQNPDGGFGESTSSYQLTSDAGHGPSTPSQTAWVLWALSHAGRAKSKEASRAAQYLLSAHQRHRGWVDTSVTGTGHPGLLYMVYPSYAAAFPLMALGTYQRKLKG